MCDSHQPLNGADSELRCYRCNQTGATYQRPSGRWYHYACWTEPQTPTGRVLLKALGGLPDDGAIIAAIEEEAE